jgi:activator of HSP90 ATPase
MSLIIFCSNGHVRLDGKIGSADGPSHGLENYTAYSVSRWREAVTKPIHQEISFKGSPQTVYEALVDAEKFSAFTGAPAEIVREVGGAVSCFGGMISGRFVELVTNKRIVQAWRAGNWPEGVYSIIKLEFAPQGSGTKLTFDHAGFPEDNREHLDAGWHTMYWEPLKKYLS